MSSGFIYNPTDGGSYAHAPSLVRLGDGTLLCAWYAYPEKEDYKLGRICCSRLLSGGSTWMRGETIFPLGGSSAGNPVFYFEEDTGKLHLLFALIKGDYWTDAELHESESSDGGRTWSSPRSVGMPHGILARHPPVRRLDGSFLLPAYDERSNETVLLAGGASAWTEQYRFVGTPLIQPSLIQETEESLSLYFRPCGEPYVIWRSRSSDGGRTWSSPIQTLLPCPLSGVAAMRRYGKTAVVYNHSREHKRFPLSLAGSSDGGVTWSEPVHLDVIEREVSYPSALLDPENMIHLVYSYNRRMIKYLSFPWANVP